ncbi:fimbria/pilus outer membrane usher protein [Shewanella sp.]|uniref:fimbria/pilus outer membrane usher protein n=1 Tax=Shewanella sp. TaxID=50422 RepID=UPI003A88EFA2
MIRLIFIFSFFFSAYSHGKIGSGEYDLDFLSGTSESIGGDWLKFGLEPGFHSVGVTLDNIYDLTMKVEFINVVEDVVPCFTAKQLAILGIVKPLVPKSCYVMEDINEDATYDYSSSRSTVTLHIPDVNKVKLDRKFKASKELWDHGINHAKLNYNSYLSTDTDGYNNSYIALNALASLGRWRFVGSSSYYRADSFSSYNIGDLYTYTDIDSISSQLSFGQIKTSSRSNVNSSIPLSGVRISLSEQMINPKWNSYAPIIKDRVNSTSAKVTIMDGDKVVFSKIYSTGEFVISDLDIQAVGSTLVLVIEESDGTVRKKGVVYSKLPNMLKSGAYDYSFSLGQYRGSGSTVEEPYLFTGKFAYGFSRFTQEASFIVSDDYRYLESISTVDLEDIGAFSLGAGISSSDEFNEGYMLQASYAKYIENTDTGIQFAGTQYRSKNFKTLQESLEYSSSYLNIKNKIDISMNQKVGDYYLYFGYRRNSYHDRAVRADESLYSSFNFMLGPATVGINVSKDYYNDNESEISYGLNVSVPFGTKNRTIVSDYLSGNNNGSFNNTLGITHSNTNTTYNLSVLTNSGADNTTHGVSGSVNNNSKYGYFGARVDLAESNEKLTLSGFGGIIGYEDGFVLAPQVGETTAIFDFGDGAEGVILNNDINSQTNSDGVGVVPYPVPYGYNQINIDTSKSPNVSVFNGSGGFVPRRGATILVPVKARVGVRKLVSIDSKVDFFTQPVFEKASGNRISFVGTDNIVYIPGLKSGKTNEFYIGEDEKCNFNVDMNNHNDKLNDLINIVCEE